MKEEVKQAIDTLFKACISQEVNCKYCPYSIFCGETWLTYRASLNRNSRKEMCEEDDQ